MHTHIFKCIQSCEQPAHRRELCVVASVLCAVSHPCVSDLECLKDAFLGRVLHPFVPDLVSEGRIPWSCVASFCA